MPKSRLQRVLAILRKRYGEPKPPAAGRDPLALIIWENVAYLRDDDDRRKAFVALRERVGLAPASILAAPLSSLAAICKIGGIFPEKRARRLKEIAALALDEFGGDLRQVLTWEYHEARTALQQFPVIGEPGADKILMLCGSHAVLGLDSNALRPLYRIGYGEASKNYTKTYRTTRNAAAAELPKVAPALAEASLLLRAHGKQTCKYSAPRCEECPVTSYCRWFKMHST